MMLHELVMHSARQTPDNIAVVDSQRGFTYRELDHLTNSIADKLVALGIQRGYRVGIWLNKSVQAVATMQAILRLGAIYVPLDPFSPVSRIATIVEDCGMSAIVSTEKRALTVHYHHLQDISWLFVDSQDNQENHQSEIEASIPTPMLTDHDIAYILYTSGSTGIPKGVSISHCNALAFVEWGVQTLQATPLDHFANHAPFHFDLSVLDLYAAFSVGAEIHLIPDEIAYIPQQLVHFLIQHAITIWYSVPSIIIMMMDQAGLLERDSSALALRAMLFAGEPFPIKHLRRVYQHLAPRVRFMNLYGPTETNVCTFYEVTHIPEDWNQPVPIGKACSGDRVWALKDDKTLVQPGEEGELMVAGPTVMVGYWGHPIHPDEPYATGDLVRLLDDENYLYIGRRDQQVKVRGYRIELGAIEAALEVHAAIHEAAVIVEGNGLDARLVAFIVPNSNDHPSLLEMKQHCAERLPRYMIIDKVQILATLPRTRNGKIDRLSLAQYKEA